METNNSQNKSLGFSSPLAMALAMIAGSIGTGNIWRFPRVAATNDGGAFVIAYVIIMLFAALPLMMGEHAMGRATRKGLPGAFRDFIGNKKATWFGSFVWSIVLIMSAYYTVVVSWVAYYFGLATVNGYVNTDRQILFDQVTNGNIITVILFLILIAIAAFIAYKGVSGIEKANKFFLPVLFVCLVGIAIRTAMLPNTASGFNYLFDFEISSFFSARIWLEALTQALWSAGPGWGICIAYGVYSKQKSDVSLSSSIQGLGDISVALLAGVAIIPALFAMLAPAEAIEILKSGNNGLAFIALTGVFEQITGGQIVGMMFFAALIMAGLSSVVACFVILSQPFADAKISKKKAMIGLFIVVGIIGIPSAWSITWFSNQDFVVGMGMIIGAVFSCYAIYRYGAEKARKKLINNKFSLLHMNKWWSFAVVFLFPIMAIVMFVWWCILAIGWNPDWWNPFGTYSIGTLVFQLGLISIIALVFNNKIANSAGKKVFDTETFPPVQDNGYSS